MTTTPSNDGSRSASPPHLQGQTTAAEVARQCDLTVSEVEGWIDEAQRSMDNGFKARPKDIREQHESERRETRRHWARPICRSMR